MLGSTQGRTRRMKARREGLTGTGRRSGLGHPPDPQRYEPRAIGNDRGQPPVGRPETAPVRLGAPRAQTPKRPLRWASVNGGRAIRIRDRVTANWPDETRRSRPSSDLAACAKRAGIDTAADADTQGEPRHGADRGRFHAHLLASGDRPCQPRAMRHLRRMRTGRDRGTRSTGAIAAGERRGGLPSVDDLPATPGDEIADTGAVHDNTPVEPEARGLSGRWRRHGTGGMAGADTVAFSSCPRHASRSLWPRSHRSDPGDVDAAPLLDDLAAARGHTGRGRQRRLGRASDGAGGQGRSGRLRRLRRVAPGRRGGGRSGRQ